MNSGAAGEAGAGGEAAPEPEQVLNRADAGRWVAHVGHSSPSLAISAHDTQAVSWQHPRRRCLAWLT